ncbi:MAG TPA: 16S rRNA (guanine(966)-N(2))-methyltransferase RsmD [Longimicrobiales bacterium]|nr:16S rRNA (guanine(966)-N(2))-methyltransferase RsmD [Longimicrobiales bacterium]
MRIIAGRWKGHHLKPLKGRDVRPTTDRVREAWMSAMGGRMDGLRVLDLFAGSGALGLETLSRGAGHVVFVERARGSLRTLKANIALLRAGEEVTVVADEVFHFLRHAEPGSFDVALADPPYAGGDAARLAQLFRSDPFARELWVEHPWREALPLGPDDRTRRYGDTALTLIVAEP